MYETEVSFLQWMTFGLPIAVLLIAISWVYLSRFAFKLHQIKLSMSQDIIHEELKKLGKISFEEKAVAWVFAFTALAWMSRTFILVHWMPAINDTSIAIAAAAVLFVLPSKKDKKIGLISWDEAVKLPWGVIVLFGGGLSLAAAFRSSGLAEWIGNQLHMLEAVPVFFIILIIALLVNFLTEVTSNVATASIMLPVLAALSTVIGIHPFLLMIPATMAASCAFMLPVATAPNAIVFASGSLKVKDMAKAGFFLNVVSSVIISILSYFLLELVFGF